MRTLFLSILICTHALAEPVHIEWDGRFEKKLSAYNLFADAAAQVPNEGLFGFSITAPLFSDYALKDRFIYLPPGTAMAYNRWESFEFPVGAALVKTFSYPADFREPEMNRRLIETRLLIHTDKGWKGAAYVWNEAQTDAELKVVGKQMPLEWTHHDGTRRSTTYLVPNMNECRFCHRATGEVKPLGIKARQLRATGLLDLWKERGVLTGVPDESDIPGMVAWDDESAALDERAAAYFDVNCAHCHNPEGLASYTRLDLSFMQEDAHYRGVYHRPTAAGNSSRGRFFAIVPGDPYASFLLHRMNSTSAQVRMPQTGRTVVHEEGVALIHDWILSLQDE